MLNPTNEQLSALLDSELAHPETNHFITALQQDQELQKSWQRYHLIGDALRKNLPADMTHGLALRVRERLQSEPTVLAPRTATIHAKIRQLKPALRQLGGLVIAASVTALTILSLQPSPSEIGNGDAAQTASVAQQPLSPASPASAVLASGVPRWDRLGEQAEVQTQEVQTKLNAFLTNHHEYAPPTAMHGMLPEARLVGHSAAQ